MLAGSLVIGRDSGQRRFARCTRFVGTGTSGVKAHPKVNPTNQAAASWYTVCCGISVKLGYRVHQPFGVGMSWVFIKI